MTAKRTGLLITAAIAGVSLLFPDIEIALQITKITVKFHYRMYSHLLFSSLFASQRLSTMTKSWEDVDLRCYPTFKSEIGICLSL